MVVGKNIVLEDFQNMYEPHLQCLESIKSTDGCDGSSVIQVSGFLKSLRNSTFIAVFHTIKHIFGVTHRLNSPLQGSDCDILEAFQIIGSVKQVLQNVRSNIDETFPSVYISMKDIARLAGVEDLAVTRKCGCQTTRNNVSATTANEHFKRSIFVLFSDCFLREFNSRFTTLALQVVLVFNIIPAQVERLTVQTINSVYDRFLLIFISAACAERSNSSLRFVKNRMRSSMREDKFNALMLLYK